MIPDTVFNSRRLLWAVCVIALPCFFRQPQNVIVTLYKTPDANRLREFYKDAVATCSKQ
jgi:hypothetical protein